MTKLHSRPVLVTVFLGVLASTAAMLPTRGGEDLEATHAPAIASIGVATSVPTTSTNPAPASTLSSAMHSPLAATTAEPTAIAEATLSYPDGSTRPVLNGVTASVVPSFTANVPFAPIVDTEVGDHGLTWYVHDNGARSTSFLDESGESLAMAYMPVTRPTSTER